MQKSKFDLSKSDQSPKYNQMIFILQRLFNASDCGPGFYGENCQHKCGRCKAEEACDTTSGVCPNGCQVHWVLPNCTGKSLKITFWCSVPASNGNNFREVSESFASPNIHRHKPVKKVTRFFLLSFR